MATHTLSLPVSEAQIRQLKANDVVYLTGTVVTARDQAHRRALEWHSQGKPLPVNLEGMVDPS